MPDKIKMNDLVIDGEVYDVEDDRMLVHDTQDNTTTFTSSDVADAEATEYEEVAVLESGEKHSSIFAKISKMFKNIRFLNNQVTQLNSNTITIEPNTAVVLDGVAVPRRHGKVCTIDFNWKMKAGTYANTDVLGTCSVSPDHTTRCLLLGNEKAYHMRLLANGQICFNNSSITFSSDTYLHGQMVFIIG